MTNKLPTTPGTSAEIKPEAVAHFSQLPLARTSHFLIIHPLKLTTQRSNPLTTPKSDKLPACRGFWSGRAGKSSTSWQLVGHFII
jgi:hypothetical protein